MEQSNEVGDAKSQIKGEFIKNYVLVERQEDVDFLSNSGYGVREQDRLKLYRYEGLYLVAERRLKVFRKGEEMAFQELLKAFQSEDAEIWAKYLMFRDLKSRGYVVREAPLRDIGFRVYDRGTYATKAARYIVFLLREGNPVNVQHLWSTLRLTQGMKKKLIVTVMDRRGEIVYYSLDQFNPS